MGILRGFLPFIAFAILSGPMGPDRALRVAAVIAIIMVGRDMAQRGVGSLKLLELASAVIFVALAAASAMIPAGLSLFALKLIVDSALAVIAIVSMLIRRPFTLQYAREQVAPQFWDSPVFIRTNYRITAVWAAAFVVQAAMCAAGAFAAGLPQAVPTAVIALAFLGAVLFTVEYPKRVRARARAA